MLCQQRSGRLRRVHVHVGVGSRFIYTGSPAVTRRVWDGGVSTGVYVLAAEAQNSLVGDHCHSKRITASSPVVSRPPSSLQHDYIKGAALLK